MTRFTPWRRDADELTLLAIGDVHLGTRSASLPADLDEEIDPRVLTPEAALNSAVALAIDESVDAVLFAGDVVESTNARFEALRPLESAVRKLLDADILVLGVVGNHDVEALPRLARMIDGFELIGEGGRWQARVLEKAGRPIAEIVGWSFPEKKVRSSPVDQLLREPLPPSHPGIVRIGLLHADLDASGGPYAPITRRELLDTGFDAWLLGHVHKPSLPHLLGSDNPAEAGDIAPHGYLGSLVGLDPGEQGPHGPWLVQLRSTGEVRTHQVAMAPLRWQEFAVRVEPEESPEDIADRLLSEAVRVASEVEQSAAVAPRVLGLRPRLVGGTRHYEALRRRISDGEWQGMSRQAGDTLVFIDKVLDGLDLAHDLAELARGDDPPALLARQLLILEEEGDERRDLLDRARMSLTEITRNARWSALDDPDIRDAADPLSDASLTELLTRSATSALSQLLAQRDASVEGDSREGSGT